VRAATRRIAAAASVDVFEDLGVQMNRHSTLVRYLKKLVGPHRQSRQPGGPVRTGGPSCRRACESKRARSTSRRGARGRRENLTA